MAKPHVKTAATGIAKDVVGRVSSALFEGLNRRPQEGSSLVYVTKPTFKSKCSRSRRSRPPKTHKKGEQHLKLLMK